VLLKENPFQNIIQKNKENIILIFSFEASKPKGQGTFMMTMTSYSKPYFYYLNFKGLEETIHSAKNLSIAIQIKIK
jgi:hypothetical protein